MACGRWRVGARARAEGDGGVGVNWDEGDITNPMSSGFQLCLHSMLIDIIPLTDGGLEN